MKNKAHFISFENLIYKQKNGNFEEDDLFKELTKECDLQNPFEYQLAFFKTRSNLSLFFSTGCKTTQNSILFSPTPRLSKLIFGK